MFSLCLRIVALCKRIIWSKTSPATPPMLAVQLVASQSLEPHTIVAMAEGAQQAHEAEVAVDILVSINGSTGIAELVEAVEPYAKQAESIDLIGASTAEDKEQIYLHFLPADENK